MSKYLSIFAGVLVAFAVISCAEPEPDQPMDNSASTPSSEIPEPDETPRASEIRQAKQVSKSGYDITPLPQTVVKELSKDLDPEELQVTCMSGTERAFTGKYWNLHDDGTYVCVVCGLPLFKSGTKFESGTGWPSFYRPFDPAHVRSVEDRSLGMTRTEIRCSRCGGHLGHVFPDGPKPTGLRYCLNSAALNFIPEGQPIPPLKGKKQP